MPHGKIIGVGGFLLFYIDFAHAKEEVVFIKSLLQKSFCVALVFF
jgi:hypothetical protein